MVFKGGHSVGVVGGDSAPGLPFLDWSLTCGDLRPAHFLGLHALQILPIAGWLINQWVDGPMRMKLAGVAATAALVAAVIVFLFVQAMVGVPFVRLLAQGIWRPKPPGAQSGGGVALKESYCARTILGLTHCSHCGNGTKPMISRFQGEGGHARLIAGLRAQRIVSDEETLAEEIAKISHLIQLEPNTPSSEFIKQGATDNDIYLILDGKVSVRVNGREVAVRVSGHQVGEMALID